MPDPSSLPAFILPAGAIASRDFGFFPTRFVGTSGNDQFTIAQDPTHSRLQIGDYSIDKSLITSLSFDGGDGNDQLSVSLDAGDLLGLNLDGFEQLILNGGQIQLGGITPSFIDVATADVTLIFNAAVDRDNRLAQINAMLSSGRNGGLWNGSGIASSAAAADDQHILGLAAIGSWQLDPSDPNDRILIKLVKNGDSDLDGDVDADDYARLDAAWADPPAQASYFTGDFNYNGRIDSDDFFLIDHAFSA